MRIGTRLGPYEILAPLGAGGIGEVYRARDARLARDVAIKPENLMVTGDGFAKCRRLWGAFSSTMSPALRARPPC